MAKRKKMAYRWPHALDWIDWKIGEYAAMRDRDLAVAELAMIARELASHLDGDQLQDTFQSEMDADGFFEAE